MTLTRLAQKLRHNPTPAEIRLWRLIHPFRTGGVHFRKQVPIGPFIADFACHHAKLVIEVDGWTHYTAQTELRDAQRDAFLAHEGYRVLRFSNLDVMRNGEGVFAVIAEALAAYLASKAPSPALPTEGEGAGSAAGKSPADQRTRPDTSPLVGEAGRGAVRAALGGGLRHD